MQNVKKELQQLQNVFNKQLESKPQKLYKYKCFDKKTIDSIRNNYIWLSKLSDLNDPFESFINANFHPNKLINFVDDYHFFADNDYTQLWHNRVKNGENVIEVLKSMIGNIQNTEEKMLANDKLYYCYRNMCKFYMESSSDFIKLIDKSFLIGSLTTNPLSITMWSHYADSHNGICIEYDLSENPYIDAMVLPVIYTNTTLSVDDIQDNEFLLYAMLLKSFDWQYEDEWRVIVPTQDNRFHAKPSAIYLGAKGWQNDKTFNEVKLLAKEKNIDLHLVHKSYTNYELEDFNFTQEFT